MSRRQTALFLDELGMGAAELTQSATSQRFGQAASADYLVLLRILGGAGLAAEVTVEDVATAKQVWSGTVTGPTPDLPTLAAKVADPLISALHLPPAQPPPSVPGRAPALAVLDFHSEGAASTLDRHLADLADLLSANLTAFDVPLVERQKLSAILAELGLSASGLVRVADMAKVGHLLGAERMLDTSMIVSGSTVVFDSQLIQPETGMVVASCRASGEEQRLPAVVQELATKVAEALRVPVTDAGRQALAQQATGSLEAALHAAAGWRLGEAGQAEVAAREYQQAVYLDPMVAGWWYQLSEQYKALWDNRGRAEALRRFFPAAEGKADPATMATMAFSLADAENQQGHAAEAEAAARLALRYHESGDAYEVLIQALAKQRRFAEARQFCESLTRRSDVSRDDLVAAWWSVLDRLCGVERGEDTATEGLIAAARVLDILKDGDPAWASGTGAVLSSTVLMCSNAGRPDWLNPGNPAKHTEECLQLARRMTTYTRSAVVPSRGWFLIGLLNYQRHRPQEAIEALTRCLEDYPAATYDIDDTGAPGPMQGKVYYLLGRVYQDLLGDRDRAVAAYQKMLFILSAGGAELDDARPRLAALGGTQLPPSPWLRSVGGAGQMIEGDWREQLMAWLHGRGYDLRLDLAPVEAQLAGQGIQILIWRGRTSDFPPAERLRAYVSGGGNLLICLGARRYSDYFESHGPKLATSSQTLDSALSWLLPAFGIGMSNRALEVASQPLSPGVARIATPLDSPSYSGLIFPLESAEALSLLKVQTEDTPDPTTAAAVTGFGLGKLAVISLRDWFVGGDLFPVPPKWHYDLFQGLLDWFAKDELSQRYPQAAQHWAAARNLVAVGEYGAAVQELDKVEHAVPSAADARYSAACLLADKVGDVDGAMRRWREVIASKEADTWLTRMAHLRMEVAAVRAGDERTAMQELPLAAGDQPDGIWGQAWVAAGDLKLAQGDYLGAAQSFRSVADELGHSEERFRALFGLAYALNKQSKPEAAARVLDSIVAEFGKAPLPTDMDQRWPDPWQMYFPRELRKKEPTVADAVAAARPKL